jgi:predicted acylesterase/phospholipase RssA
MSRALVLSGGGAHGAFQAGACQMLAAAGLSFDVIAGVSTGALSAAILAQGNNAAGFKAQSDRLLALYRQITSNADVYRDRVLGNDTLSEAGIVFESSMFDPTPIFKKLVDTVNPAVLAASGVLFRCGVTNLDQGTYVTVTEKTARLLDYIRASASMPCFFPNEVIDGDHWCDGGVVHQTPLDEAFKALAQLRPPAATMASVPPAPSPDEMYIILCDPVPVGGPAKSSYGNALKIIPRVVDVMTWNKYAADLANACLANRDGRKLASGRSAAYVKLSIIAPAAALPGDTLTFRPDYIEVGIAAGKAAPIHDQAWLEQQLGIAA